MCSIFLIKPQRQKTVLFAAMYQLKRVTIAILHCASFHSFYCLMNRKGKCLNSVSIRIIECFAVSTVTTRDRMLSFGTDTAPQSFCHSFIAMSMIHCSKSAQKSAVQMCQVAAVVMETTQLVLSQFKNVLS